MSAERNLNFRSVARAFLFTRWTFAKKKKKYNNKTNKKRDWKRKKDGRRGPEGRFRGDASIFCCQQNINFTKASGKILIKRAAASAHDWKVNWIVLLPPFSVRCLRNFETIFPPTDLNARFPRWTVFSLLFLELQQVFSSSRSHEKIKKILH